MHNALHSYNTGLLAGHREQLLPFKVAGDVGTSSGCPEPRCEAKIAARRLFDVPFRANWALFGQTLIPKRRQIDGKQ